MSRILFCNWPGSDGHEFDKILHSFLDGRCTSLIAPPSALFTCSQQTKNCTCGRPLSGCASKVGKGRAGWMRRQIKIYLQPTSPHPHAQTVISPCVCACVRAHTHAHTFHTRVDTLRTRSNTIFGTPLTAPTKTNALHPRANPRKHRHKYIHVCNTPNNYVAVTVYKPNLPTHCCRTPKPSNTWAYAPTPLVLSTPTAPPASRYGHQLRTGEGEP